MDDACKGNGYIVMTDAKDCFCKIERDVDVEALVVEVEEDYLEVGVLDDTEDGVLGRC